ncbi:MAG: tol-pal system protein YbgF [Geobacteraceae bacterium]|nr:tol-pal system protein YbgF [Geobacteraceae bacterium]
MRTFYLVFLSLVLCCAAGCASRGDLRSVERDSYDTRRRVTQLEKDMATVRKTAADEVQRSLDGFRKEIDAARKGMAETQAAQETIRVDLQEMSGRVDDLKILVQKRTDEKAFSKEETERRLNALEERLSTLEKKLGAETATKETVETPEGIYQAGLTSYKAGDMQKAREAFTRFVERYPAHDLTPNARYWIGETYYSEKKYEQAILAFQDVIKLYPKKDKAPAALLKQALSFKSLGDVKSSRYVLKKIQDDYPRSLEAKRAKELLAEMK